jgi:hypothetical protein
MAERKAFLLRIDPRLLDAVQTRANDDLRSLNAQIEFLCAAPCGGRAARQAATWMSAPDAAGGQPARLPPAAVHLRFQPVAPSRQNLP